MPDFVLEVLSPSTAENDARRKATEYARIGVCEHWRLDPEGSLMGTALEGYVASGGLYDPVEAVGGEGRGRYLRSRVLGLDICGPRQDGAIVLVFRDPQTGEEFDGGLEEADLPLGAAENRAQHQAGLGPAADEPILPLEERLRKVTACVRRPGRRIQGASLTTLPTSPITPAFG